MTIGANLNGGSLTLGAAGATNLFLRGSEVKINEAGGGTVFIGNTTSGTTDINSKITNIGTTGLPGTGRVNIGTGANATGSQVNIGSDTAGLVTIAGNANIATNGGVVNIGTVDVNIGTGGTIGNTIIGNNSKSGYTLISSKGITMNRFLGDGQYIDIAAEANTTTGYIILGSGNLQYNYIRGRKVNINSDTNGDVQLCNGTGILYIYSPLRVSYNPSIINSNQHIGWNNRQSNGYFGVIYGGGDKVYWYNFVPPGVYICTYSSIAFRTTNSFKALFYWTTQEPVNNIVNTTGGGYAAESENDNRYGYPDFVRITGTAIISITTASYIGLIQYVFAVNTPNDNLGYIVNIVRVG